MGSKTAKPFRSTNLTVFAPENKVNESQEGNFIASGDALIVDPGCRSEFQEEVWLGINYVFKSYITLTSSTSNFHFVHEIVCILLIAVESPFSSATRTVYYFYVYGLKF